MSARIPPAQGARAPRASVVRVFSLRRKLARLVPALAVVPCMAVAGVAAPPCELELDLAGTNLGSIADGALGGTACVDPGAPRDVMFTMIPVPGYVLVDVGVSLGLTHSWLGDLTATLAAPDGTTHTLFGRVGATTATACGDSSNMDGEYAFNDFAASPFGGMWQAASAVSGAETVMPGLYRTTDSGGDGAVQPMPPTSLRTTFTGPGADNFSGTWTVRITDGGENDTGAVTSATLSLCLGALADTIFANGFEGIAF